MMVLSFPRLVLIWLILGVMVAPRMLCVLERRMGRSCEGNILAGDSNPPHSVGVANRNNLEEGVVHSCAYHCHPVDNNAPSPEAVEGNIPVHILPNVDDAEVASIRTLVSSRHQSLVKQSELPRWYEYVVCVSDARAHL